MNAKGYKKAKKKTKTSLMVYARKHDRGKKKFNDFEYFVILFYSIFCDLQSTYMYVIGVHTKIYARNAHT